MLAFAFTPYFYVPTSPRIAIVATLFGMPLVGGLVLWTICELVPSAKLWGLPQALLACASTILLSASLAAVFWLPDRGIGSVLIRLNRPVALVFLVAMKERAAVQAGRDIVRAIGELPVPHDGDASG